MFCPVQVTLPPVSISANNIVELWKKAAMKKNMTTIIHHPLHFLKPSFILLSLEKIRSKLHCTGFEMVNAPSFRDNGASLFDGAFISILKSTVTR